MLMEPWEARIYSDADRADFESDVDFQRHMLLVDLVFYTGYVACASLVLVSLSAAYL